MKRSFLHILRSVVTLLLCFACSYQVLAQADEELPPRPDPPHLVNDLAHVLTPDQVQQLEDKLVAYDKTTSTQIAIVTLESIGVYEPAEYGTALFKKWKIGNEGKNNGVLVLAAIKDRKVNITTGYGLEGALPDAVCGRIIREEIKPAFQQEKYFEGFNNAADKIIAATKGEYTAEPGYGQKGGKKGIGAGAIVIIIVLIYFIIWMSGRGGGGGNYMSGRGARRWGGGWGTFGGFGGFGGGWGGGSGDSGGGGFGGFGGGDTGGGGASGSW